MDVRSSKKQRGGKFSHYDYRAPSSHVIIFLLQSLLSGNGFSYNARTSFSGQFLARKVVFSPFSLLPEGFLFTKFYIDLSIYLYNFHSHLMFFPFNHARNTRENCGKILQAHRRNSAETAFCIFFKYFIPTFTLLHYQDSTFFFYFLLHFSFWPTKYLYMNSAAKKTTDFYDILFLTLVLCRFWESIFFTFWWIHPFQAEF